MTALEPKQQRSAETRRRLLDAAVDELLESGPAGLNTHAVAQRAGITRGAQQHHFPRKEVLVAEAVRHLAERQEGQMKRRSVRIRRMPNALARTLDLLYEQYSGPLFAASLELAFASRHEPGLEAIMVAHERERSRGINELALAALDPATLEAPDFAARWSLALATVRGIALLRLLGHPRDVVDERWAFARDELVAGFARQQD